MLNLWYRFRYGIRVTLNRLKNIRFTKYHLKYWMWKMILNAAFAFKGLIGLITFGLIEPDITARASMGMARMLGRVQEYTKVEIAKKEDPESELARTVVSTSTARFEMPDDDVLDALLKNNAGKGALTDKREKEKSRIRNIKITKNGETLSDTATDKTDESVN